VLGARPDPRSCHEVGTVRTILADRRPPRRVLRRAALGARATTVWRSRTMFQRPHQMVGQRSVTTSSRLKAASCRATRFQRTRIVLDEHNVEYEIRHRTVAIARSPLRKLHGTRLSRLRREEQRAWRTSCLRGDLIGATRTPSGQLPCRAHGGRAKRGDTQFFARAECARPADAPLLWRPRLLPER